MNSMVPFFITEIITEAHHEANDNINKIHYVHVS